jgi:hypothetical protein
VDNGESLHMWGNPNEKSEKVKYAKVGILFKKDF